MSCLLSHFAQAFSRTLATNLEKHYGLEDRLEGGVSKNGELLSRVEVSVKYRKQEATVSLNSGLQKYRGVWLI